MGSQINEPEILLCDISDAHTLILVKSFRVDRFNHAGRTLSVTTADAASRSGDSEGAPLATPCVLNEASSVVLLDGLNRLQALFNLQKAKNVTCVKALSAAAVRHTTRRPPNRGNRNSQAK